MTGSGVLVTLNHLVHALGQQANKDRLQKLATEATEATETTTEARKNAGRPLCSLCSLWLDFLPSRSVIFRMNRTPNSADDVRQPVTIGVVATINRVFVRLLQTRGDRAFCAVADHAFVD